MKDKIYSLLKRKLLKLFEGRSIGMVETKDNGIQYQGINIYDCYCPNMLGSYIILNVSEIVLNINNQIKDKTKKLSCYVTIDKKKKMYLRVNG